MINQRIFSANVGDSSVGIAGPDAIEQDIDNLLANDQELLGVLDFYETQVGDLDVALIEHKAENASKHIKESGSNENGSYIRFDDGTMICTHRFLEALASPMAKGETRNAEWVFPAQFLSRTAYSFFANCGLYKLQASVDYYTVTSVRGRYSESFPYEPTRVYYVYSLRDTTSTDPADRVIHHLLAIGRWK